MGTFNPFSLEGKTILVTGASSGIGQGIAIACSKMGATVIVGGRNEQRLQATLEQLEGEGHQCMVADLTDRTKLIESVATLPKLNGIVHCAGIGHRMPCKMLQEEDIDNVMGTNFKAPVMLQTEILKAKKLSKGASIVFISSLGAEAPSIGNSMYAASKGAIMSYAKCLALELAPRLIRVNSILPAMVWTDLILKGGVTEEDLREDEKRYPLKRYGKPEDIANLAIYLLSDASSWMTGTDVKISGGALINFNAESSWHI